MKKKSKNQLNSNNKKLDKKPCFNEEKLSNKSKAKYDEIRQVDWSYIDGPIRWD